MRAEKAVSLRVAGMLALLLPFAVFAAEETAPAEKSANEIRLEQGKAKEKLHREKLNAVGKVLESRECTARDYQDQLAVVRGVAAELDKERAQMRAEVWTSLSHFAKDLDYAIREAWFRLLIMEARNAASEERYQPAIELATQAKKVLSDGDDSGFSGEKRTADRLIEHCTREKRNVESEDAKTIAKFDPQVDKDKKQVRQLLQEAQVFIKNRELQEAQNRVEQAFLIDPCNAEAIFLAGRLYNQYYAYGSARRKADLEGVYANADWQWAEPIFPKIAGSAMNQEQGHIKASDNDRTLARMDGIIFPQVNYIDADVDAVLDDLSEQSANYSPDHRPVAISKSFPAGANWKVSLTLNNIPMNVVMRYICQQTGLKFRVDADGILIGPEVDEMVSRRFTVPSSLNNYVIPENAPAASEDAADANDAAQSKGPKIASEDDWKNYFRGRGINFPDGSKVSYSSQAKMLIVRNTPENLQQLDTLLRQLETVANKPLIMIEVKCIEVLEEDYQELGFDWQFGTSSPYFRNGIGSNIMQDEYGETYLTGVGEGKKIGWLLNQGINTVEKGVLAAIRGSNNSALIDKLNIFPALCGTSLPFGSDNPLNISLSVYALDQNQRTENLAAPKVVTSNDVEAEVKLAKTYYFPDSWDTLEVEVETGDTTSSTTITPPVPNFPEEGTPIGVGFKVKPQVLADNRTIRMHLEPNISQYLGDDQYDMYLYYDRYENGVPVEGPGNIHVPGERFSIFKPIIARREMAVDIDLDNGETVVLGGLVQSMTTSRVDKIPLLGDLPLVGRLFQSQWDKAERTNLLFFVTARLLSYDGAPIERNHTPGVPDFNR
ncbi:MAG: hypothetical protein MJ033_01135 [Victivallaceae bacterium]|nr:hypothetical protein [Victivallaceae bacterium]